VGHRASENIPGIAQTSKPERGNMTHEERLPIVGELVKGRIKPPIKFYETNVYRQPPEIAIENLYDWYKEKGLV
jgi:hypothetical protein